MTPRRTNRLVWERVERLIELAISAIAPVAELIDALSRVLH
jgi:hypothetical protein